MKKLFVCIAFLAITVMIPTAVLAQTATDVVYLKNGSIIKGSVIELVPNESVKIETRDGSVFVYRMEEVQKMTKETVENQNGAAKNQKEVEKNQKVVEKFQTAAIPNLPPLKRRGVWWRREVWLEEGSLTFLNGKNRLNVVFEYSDLLIRGQAEKDFKEVQSTKWATEWEVAKSTLFGQRFVGHLNKNLIDRHAKLICGNYPDAEYRAIVRMLIVSNGWGIRCEVLFTRKDDTKPLAVISVEGDSRRIGGFVAAGSNVHLTGTAFGYAGQNLGKYMARRIR